MDPINLLALGVIVVLVAVAGLVRNRVRPTFKNKDADAIREAVARQIGAFLADNESVAFSHAAPRIQAKYKSGSAFLDAVRKAYLPIYRPLSYRFGELIKAHTGPTQLLHVTGPHGKDWIVSCYMEEQPNKEWKVAGFHLRLANDEEATAATAA